MTGKQIIWSITTRTVIFHCRIFRKHFEVFAAATFPEYAHVRQWVDTALDCLSRLKSREILFAQNVCLCWPIVLKFAQSTGGDTDRHSLSNISKNLTADMGVVDERDFTKFRFKLSFSGLSFIVTCPGGFGTGSCYVVIPVTLVATKLPAPSYAYHQRWLHTRFESAPHDLASLLAWPVRLVRFCIITRVNMTDFMVSQRLVSPWRPSPDYWGWCAWPLFTWYAFFIRALIQYNDVILPV